MSQHAVHTILATERPTARARRRQGLLRPSALSSRAARLRLQPKEPRAAILTYTRTLARFMAGLEEAWLFEIERFLSRQDVIDPAALPARTLRELLNRMSLQAIQLLTPEELEALLLSLGHRVDVLSTVEIGRILGAPRLVRTLGSTIGQQVAWRRANVTLIESIHRDLLPQVETILQEGQGLRVEVIRNQILRRFDVTRSRADLIARDQVLKLYGQANRTKQINVGVTEYIWSTSKDERVRETHVDLEGTRHSWTNPPIVSKDGRREHPGGDYQCRCVAIPVLPGE